MIINLDDYRQPQESKSIIQLQVDGEPVGYKSAKKGRNTWYSPNNYAEYKQLLTDAILYHCKVLSIPPSTLQRDRYGLSLVVYRSRDHGDLDNFTKPVKDSLQAAGVVKNDKQITDYLYPYCMRIDKTSPRVWFNLVRLAC